MNSKSDQKPSERRVVPFGARIGVGANNMIAYSSDTTSRAVNSDDRSYVVVRRCKYKTYDDMKCKLTIIKNIFCGIRYQCVEYVRRWHVLKNNVTFQNIKNAYELYVRKYVIFSNIWTGERVPYTKTKNGYGKIHVGSIIVWDGTPDYTTGHVAVVMHRYGQHIYIGEQNWDNVAWNKPYSRKIPIHKKNQNIYLNDGNIYGLPILGWLTVS